jgi:hypothetical protein
MAGQDFLLDSQVQAWLDGLEPAWTLLTFRKFADTAARTGGQSDRDPNCQRPKFRRAGRREAS